LFPCATGVEFLAGVKGVVMDGGDESVCDGLDGVIDVGVCVEDDFGGAG